MSDASLQSAGGISASVVLRVESLIASGAAAAAAVSDMAGNVQASLTEMKMGVAASTNAMSAQVAASFAAMSEAAEVSAAKAAAITEQSSARTLAIAEAAGARTAAVAEQSAARTTGIQEAAAARTTAIAEAGSARVLAIEEASGARAASIAEQSAARVTAIQEGSAAKATAAAQASVSKVKASLNELSTFALEAGAAITLALGGLAMEGAKLETTLVTVANNTSMTDAEIATMTESVKRMGAETGASMEQLATGFMKASNFGFDMADSIKIVNAAMRSAVASGGDVGKTTEILANILHEFSMSASQASGAMAMLHLEANKGNMTLEEFVEAAGPAFSMAANLGVGVGEVSAAMAALTEHGFDAGRATTQMIGIMKNIAEPSEKASKAIEYLSKKTGIDLVSDFTAAGLANKGLQRILDDLAKAARLDGDTLGDAILQIIPATRGGIGALALAGTAMDDFKARSQDAADTLSGRVDPTLSQFARQQLTLTAQLNKARNEIVLLGSDVERALLPALQDAITAARGVAEWFSNLSSETKSTLVQIALFTGGALLLGGSLLKLVLMLEQLRLAVLALRAAALVPLIATLGEFLPVIAAVAVAVGVAALAYNALTESTAKTDEELKKDADANLAAAEAARDNAAKVRDLAAEIEDLEKKTRPTREETDRLKTLLNQLSVLSPDLVTGFNNQGDALHSVAGAYSNAADQADRLTEAAWKASGAVIGLHVQKVAQARSDLQDQLEHARDLSRRGVVETGREPFINYLTGESGYHTQTRPAGAQDQAGYASDAQAKAAQIAALTREIDAGKQQMHKAMNPNEHSVFDAAMTGNAGLADPHKDRLAAKLKAQEEADKKARAAKKHAASEAASDAKSAAKEAEKDAEKASEDKKKALDRKYALEHNDYEVQRRDARQQRDEYKENKVPKSVYGPIFDKTMLKIQADEYENTLKTMGEAGTEQAALAHAAMEQDDKAGKAVIEIWKKISEAIKKEVERIKKAAETLAESTRKAVEAHKAAARETDAQIHYNYETGATDLPATIAALQKRLAAVKGEAEEERRIGLELFELKKKQASDAAKSIENSVEYERSHNMITLAAYIAYLKQRLSAFKAYSEQWMQIEKQIQEAEKEQKTSSEGKNAGWQEIVKGWHDIVKQMGDEAKQALGDVLTKGISGHWKDAFKEIGSAFLQMVEEMVVKLIVLFAWQVLTGTEGSGDPTGQASGGGGGNGGLIGKIGKFLGFDDGQRDVEANRWGLDFGSLFMSGAQTGAARATRLSGAFAGGAGGASSGGDTHTHVHLHNPIVRQDADIDHIIRRVSQAIDRNTDRRAAIVGRR